MDAKFSKFVVLKHDRRIIRRQWLETLHLALHAVFFYRKKGFLRSHSLCPWYIQQKSAIKFS